MTSSGQRVWIVHALIGLMVIVLLALVARLLYIQEVMRPELNAWTEDRLYSEIPIRGRRGKIYDRKHRLLAGSLDRPTIYADPYLVEDKAETARRLAQVMPLEEAELRKRLWQPTSPRYVILARQVDSDVADAVRDLVREKVITGVDITMEPARDYPQGRLAAHVIGFVDADSRGREGIEWSCGQHLRAEHGKRVVFRGAGNRAMFQEPDSYVAPKDGRHVILTIDAAIQEVTEKAVAERVSYHAAESGVGIVMDCRTGEILAMANVPDFEPARPGAYPPEARRNRTLTDPVEPGSIFKPFIMTEALALRLTTPQETIFCENGLFVIGRRLLHDHHPMGHLTTEMILVRSSNIGMAKLGLRLGNARMFDALTRYGYGGATGIDLPGESAGLLSPLKDWNSYTTTSVPMGHEMAVTPIQLAAAFSAIMNGGKLLQPRVVAAVVDHRGQIIEDRTEVIEKKRALDEDTSRVMRAMLAQVINHPRGTGKACRLDKWQVMGKTGTAQVPRENRRGYEGYLASFIAGAPWDQPRLTVLVMIRKPTKNNYYGSVVALPAVKEILEMALPYLDVPPDETKPDEVGEVVLQH